MPRGLSGYDGSLQPGPNSLYLTGSVTLTTVLVSGVAADLQFSTSEMSIIFGMSVGAIQIVNATAPTPVTVQHQVLRASVDAAPIPTCSSGPTPWLSCQDVWLTPALAKLGFANNLSGFLDQQKTANGTTWSCGAFYTKYPQWWFGYATAPDSSLFIQWGATAQAGGAGLIAHEFLHLFGAGDEYDADGHTCSCAPSGTFFIPNLNCTTCSGGGAKLPCIMTSTGTRTLCPYTQLQVGWENWFSFGGTNAPMISVSVTDDGWLWAVDANRNVYKAQAGIDANEYTYKLSWQTVTGQLQMIAGMSQNAAWGLNNSTPYAWDGEDWVQMPMVSGGFGTLSVGSDGTVWALDTNDAVWSYSAANNNWTQVGGILQSISVGSIDNIWGLRNQEIYYHHPVDGWVRKPGALTSIAAGPNNEVWGLSVPSGSTQGNVYQRSAEGVFVQVPGSLSQISVGGPVSLNGPPLLFGVVSPQNGNPPALYQRFFLPSAPPPPPGDASKP